VSSFIVASRETKIVILRLYMTFSRFDGLNGHAPSTIAPSNAGVTEKAIATRMFRSRSLVDMRGRGDTRIYRSRICPETPTTLLCLWQRRH
jgi:hypothetical protein